MSWNIFVEILTCYGVIYKVGCVLTFYNGLIIEARYTSVLKICEHKRCHVNQFSAAKSKWMLWNIFMRSPLHSERAVRLKASVLHLQRLTHDFWHLQETSSMQLWSASGSCELPQVVVSCLRCRCSSMVCIVLQSLTNPSWLVAGVLMLAVVSDPTQVHFDIGQ